MEKVEQTPFAELPRDIIDNYGKNFYREINV